MGTVINDTQITSSTSITVDLSSLQDNETIVLTINSISSDGCTYTDTLTFTKQPC